MYKKTKIVATVSDMRCDVGFIQQLYDAGMNVVRVSSRIAILVDTKGPEVRTTPCAAPITFEKGDRVRIVGDPSRETTRECIAVSYPGFVHDMTVGAHILIDDGDLGLVVERKEDDCVECLVENAATLGARKSVNVPGVRVNLPALTERDRANIRFAIDADVAFIAHSFVRSREDVLEVRRLLDAAGSDIRIIAKIENQEGVDNIDEILDVADGIMVARGDLGIEVAQELIPGIQRRLVAKAIRRHKPVIVATQMLQSMIKAYGAYPVEAVQTMAAIASQAEKDIDQLFGDEDVPLSVEPDVTEFFAKEAVMATKRMKLRAIIVDSYTGRTARYVSSFRGQCTVLAICYKAKTVRHLALSYGVSAIYMPFKSFGHEFLLAALRKLLADGLLHPEDRICYLGSQRKEQNTSFMEMNIVQNLFVSEGEEPYQN